MKAEKYLHFEDNEVLTLDANETVLERETFKSAAEAKEAFDQKVSALNLDPAVGIQFVHYVPKFPPQRLGIWEKNIPQETLNPNL